MNKALQIILALFMAFLLLSCTQTPAGFTKQVAGEIYLSNKITMVRERQFTIPALSQVIVSVHNIARSNEDNAHLYPSLLEGSQAAISAVFVNNTSTGASLLSQADYWLEITPLNVVDGFVAATQDSAKAKPSGAKSIETSVVDDNDSIYIRPHRAKLKLILYDARSRQLLDIAIVEARSGALFKKNFNAFIETLVAAYGNSISSSNNISVN